MSWDNWALDVSTWPERCWCPVEDGKLVLGMNFVADWPPGEPVSFSHPLGDDALEVWCEAHEQEFREMVMHMYGFQGP